MNSRKKENGSISNYLLNDSDDPNKKVGMYSLEEMKGINFVIKEEEFSLKIEKIVCSLEKNYSVYFLNQITKRDKLNKWVITNIFKSIYSRIDLLPEKIKNGEFSDEYKKDKLNANQNLKNETANFILKYLL